MSQEDVWLNVPLCTWSEIQACEDPLSRHKVMTHKNGVFQFSEKEVDGETRPERVCERAVPGACPRIRCGGDTGEQRPCRLIGLIETEHNDDGFWLKMPCSECPERRDLHPQTQRYVQG